MVLVATKRRGLGIVPTSLLTDGYYSGPARAIWTPAMPPIAVRGQSPSQPRYGATSQDASGNVYTYGSSGWQLTTPASSGTVPSTAAQPAPATASGFPSNPTINQTYVDASGNTWTYTTTGWQETAPVATAASTSTSWFTESSIAGIPNYWLVAGGGFLLILMMKGRR